MTKIKKTQIKTPTSEIPVSEMTTNERRQAIEDKLRKHRYKLDEICTEFEISPRTFWVDITFLKERGAIITRTIENKQHYYRYENRNFSAFRSKQLTGEDVARLQETMLLLENFKHLPHYKALETVHKNIEKELRYHDKPTIKRVIDFDTVPRYQNLSLLQPLYEAIKGQKVLQFQYQAFGREAVTLRLHPYFLKEYRSRWYIFGWDDTYLSIANYAIDRIVPRSLCEKGEGETTRSLVTSPTASASDFKPLIYRTPKDDEANLDIFFNHIIGVTRPNIQKVLPADVIFRCALPQANYLKTKPLHRSQTITQQTETYFEFKMSVYLNRELEMQLLQFGADITVLAPASLRDRLQEEARRMLDNYSMFNQNATG